MHVHTRHPGPCTCSRSVSRGIDAQVSEHTLNLGEWWNGHGEDRIDREAFGSTAVRGKGGAEEVVQDEWAREGRWCEVMTSLSSGTTEEWSVMSIGDIVHDV